MKKDTILSHQVYIYTGHNDPFIIILILVLNYLVAHMKVKLGTHASVNKWLMVGNSRTQHFQRKPLEYLTFIAC